jgi:hypothetical protein
MLPSSTLLAFAALVLAAGAGMSLYTFSSTHSDTSCLAPSGDDPLSIVPPATPRAPSSLLANKLDTSKSLTDSQKILSTVKIVDQKRGANDDSVPGLPVSKTLVTAIDGKLTKAGSKSNVESPTDNTTVFKRAHSTYDQVFAGTGTGLGDRDGAIMGTAYLTYTVVSNSTYNVDACLDFCDSVSGCGVSQTPYFNEVIR